MANAVKLANKVRTILAEGLETLQAESDAPEVLMEIAAPIAQAMGIMHGIERSEGTDLERAGEAMSHVRGALDQLLSTDSNHPAVEPTVEAVATSLSKIFGLTRIRERAKVEAKAAAKAEAKAAAKAEAKAAAKAEAKAAAKAEAKAAAKAEAKAAAKAEAETAAKAEAEAVKKERPSRRGRLSSRRAERAATEKKKSDARPEAKTLKMSNKDSADRSRAPESSGRRHDQKRPASSSRAKAKEAGPYDPQVPGTADLPRPTGDSPNFDVELGAHSGSNFYKGLSGNDVIDHGGLFVATYRFPSRGTAITVTVHLPGDLNFTAEAIVQWTRDTRSGESEPGFGARITRISAEGRQLVYRYVRNREPIFYDDF